LDDESLVVCPVTVPDQDLGATAIRLLRDQRRPEFPMGFGSEGYGRRLAARRRLLCKAFGVKAMKSWLPGATCVSCRAANNELTIHPWLHSGKQDAWSGHAADPVETVSLSDPRQVGQRYDACSLSACRQSASQVMVRGNSHGGHKSERPGK
jgi:hypothetical protein